MRPRLLIALIGGLTILANLWFSVSPALAVAAGIAVVLVGEGVGRLSRAAVLAPLAVSGSQPLSRREVEVAVLIAQGLTSKEVAEFFQRTLAARK